MDAEGQLVIRRTVGADGRRRGFVNDQPVSAGLLRRLAETLIEIHGQFETHGLFDQSTHSILLNSYGDDGGLVREEVRRAWRNWWRNSPGWSPRRKSAAAEEDYLEEGGGRRAGAAEAEAGRGGDAERNAPASAASKPYQDHRGVLRPGAFSMEALMDGSGWTWAIPLHDGTLSVGVVVHRDVYTERRRSLTSLGDYFEHTLQRSPDVNSLILGAVREGEIRVWRDYSYFASEFAGPGYRLAGDAAGFIDPLFSTGVHLAFLGALSAAATICAVVRDEVDESVAQLFHERCLRQAYTRLMVTVAGFYCQIRDQEHVVLPSVSSDNFQLAFDWIQPIVSGNVDVNSDEIPPETLLRAMQYTTDMMLEAHDIKTGSRVAKMMSAHVMNDAVVERSRAVDGMYIRFERGRLGLERLGAFASALAGAQRRIVRGVLSVTA